MKFTHPPAATFLYKYCSPEVARLILQSKKVRFSPISEFNDPFELKIFPSEGFTPFEFGHAIANNILDVLYLGEELQTDGSVQKLIKAYQEGHFEKMSAQDFAMDVGVMLAKKSFTTEPSQWAQVVHGRIAKEVGAFCLSEAFNNLLMWAHYSKNHEGFVIGFDVTKGEGAFDRMAPVLYRDKYPTDDDAHGAAARFLGRKDKENRAGKRFMQMNLFTKSSEWSYEREWRALGGNFENSLVEVAPAAFVSLYTGCRSNSQTISEVVGLARSLNPNIGVMKAKISTNAFALEFQDFDEPWVSNYPPKDQVL